MSKFSKILSLLILATMLLTACGGGATQAPTAAPATEAPTTAATEAPTQAATEAPTAAATEAPTQAAGAIDCMDAKSGDEVSMLYQWSGVEETNLNTILQPL
ncbi:MAG TPA: hypothetical protein VK206_06030, partial [Anaerolineales bacterium]|nr:hypothetical protein [Anaerolineales bacterium]